MRRPPQLHPQQDGSNKPGKVKFPRAPRHLCIDAPLAPNGNGAHTAAPRGIKKHIRLDLGCWSPGPEPWMRALAPQAQGDGPWVPDL